MKPEIKKAHQTLVDMIHQHEMKYAKPPTGVVMHNHMAKELTQDVVGFNKGASTLYYQGLKVFRSLDISMYQFKLVID